MPNELKYLVVHCTATPEGRAVTAEDIRQWHLAPLDLPDGSVRYLGRTYGSRSQLPSDKLNGVPVRDLKGRGWSVVGYSVLIETGGLMTVLHHFNDDRVVDPWEITNGVQGHNHHARHIVYAGGTDARGKSKDTRTRFQLATMEKLVKAMVRQWPDIKVVGHRDLDSGKDCPSFDVLSWGRSIGLTRRNLHP